MESFFGMKRMGRKKKLNKRKRKYYHQGVMLWKGENEGRTKERMEGFKDFLCCGSKNVKEGRKKEGRFEGFSLMWK